MKKLFLGIAVCLTLSGCGDKGLSPYNPMGFSGKRNPDAESAFARAHVLWSQNDMCSDPLLAEELLSKAINLEPGYAEAYLRRGLAREQLRDWDGAFDDLTLAIRLEPTAQAYAFRGLASLRGGNHLGARKDLDKSLEITKRQHRAWNYRGALNRAEGNMDAACDDFREGCDNGDCVGIESAVARGECPE